MGIRFSPFLPRRFLPSHRWFGSILISVFLLSGCVGRTGEVRRTVLIGHPLTEATITRAIANMPGVRFSKQAGSGSLEDDADGLECTFDDDAELVNGLLSVRRAGQKGWDLTLDKTWAELTPPPGAMQKTRLLMDRVYLALRQQDPALPPPSEIKEELFGPKPSP